MYKGIKEKIENFPDSPGVYLFIDYTGKVIYVGKAKNLRKRVMSYLTDDSPKAKYILRKSKDVNYYVTDSETEALILESVLIKKYKPIMNVQLRDDKQYPLLKLTLNEEYPRLIKTRRFEDDGAKYLGPYPQSSTVRETISLVKKIFNLRSCNWNLPKSKPKRPCLNYYIGNCKAPCQGYVSKEEYWDMVKDVLSFLEGKYEKIIEKLFVEMKNYSDKLEFEKAAKVRDKIKTLQNLGERQKIISFNNENKDLIQLYIEDHKAKILVYLVREGKLIEKRIFTLNLSYDFVKDEIIRAFILQYYLNREIPDIIVIPQEISYEDFDIIKYLSDKRGAPVNLRLPINEDESKLLEMALKDLSMESLKSEKIWSALIELQKLFGLDDIPLSIEGFDISNLQGKEAVGSKVFFFKGFPDKDRYRRYKIKYVEESPNDFLMLQEVLRRRLRRVDEDPLADIVLIDGGKGQLSSAMEVFNEIGIKPELIIALAKENEEIFLPNRSKPIILPKDSHALHLLQQVRDEAHRFAISYHRKLHRKKILEPSLMKIPGVGDKRWKILMEHFSSIEDIKKASLEDLKNIPGIPEKVAEKIYMYFNR